MEGHVVDPYGKGRSHSDLPLGTVFYDVWLESVREEFFGPTLLAVMRVSSLDHKILKDFVRSPPWCIAEFRTLAEATKIKKDVEAGDFDLPRLVKTPGGRVKKMVIDRLPQPPHGETCCTVSLRERGPYPPPPKKG